MEVLGMFYEMNLSNGKDENCGWPDSKHCINVRNLKTAEEFKMPILNDNILVVGKTGYGKSTVTKAMLEPFINDDEEPFTVFLEIKDDFRKYMRSNDKAVIFREEIESSHNYFKWNMVKEIRQSEDWESELQAIVDILFSDLSADSRNRFWIEGAKDIFKGYIRVILYCYKNSPSNEKVINGMKYMSRMQMIKHLEQYKPNKFILRDYFGYDSEHADGYVPPKITGDMMAFLTIVLEKFAGTFCSSDGMDTVHNFLNGTYGKRLFLIYDYGKRGSSNIFFRFILQKIIENKLSQHADYSKKVLLVLDEAAVLEKDFGLMEAVTLGRGKNLQVILCTQSIEKLYCVAPEFNSEHITNASMAGFPTMIVFQPGDAQTVEFLQKIFGNRQKQVMCMPLSRYAMPQCQYVTEPIVSEEELSSLGVGECIVKIKACSPQRVNIIVED